MIAALCHALSQVGGALSVVAEVLGSLPGILLAALGF